MSSEQHYEAAERILAKAVDRRFGDVKADPDLMAEAKIHAILAVAEALHSKTTTGSES